MILVRFFTLNLWLLTPEDHGYNDKHFVLHCDEIIDSNDVEDEDFENKIIIINNNNNNDFIF